eukprot:63998_1
MPSKHAMADAETLDWILHWDCYPSPHPWWTSAYAISIICMLSNMILLCANIHYLLCTRDTTVDLFIKQQSNKILYLSIVILYTLGPAVYVLADSLQLGCALNVYWFLFLKATGLNIMTLATEMLYLFYVLRIKRVFQDIPSLMLSKCQLYSFSEVLFGLNFAMNHNEYYNDKHLHIVL